MFDTSSHCTAIYVALISMLAFMYIRLRRVETQLAMTNATIDVLMRGDLPSEFLPVIGRRLDEIEHRIQSCANALVPTFLVPQTRVTRSVSELRDTDSDSNAESDAEWWNRLRNRLRNRLPVRQSNNPTSVQRWTTFLQTTPAATTRPAMPASRRPLRRPTTLGNRPASPEGVSLDSMVDGGPVRAADSARNPTDSEASSQDVAAPGAWWSIQKKTLTAARVWSVPARRAGAKTTRRVHQSIDAQVAVVHKQVLSIFDD